MYKNFNVEKKDSFIKFVEFNAFWNIKANFNTDFYYCLYIFYYQNTISKKQKNQHFFDYILLNSHIL